MPHSEAQSCSVLCEVEEEEDRRGMHIETRTAGDVRLQPLLPRSLQPNAKANHVTSRRTVEILSPRSPDPLPLNAL